MAGGNRRATGDGTAGPFSILSVDGSPLPRPNVLTDAAVPNRLSTQMRSDPGPGSTATADVWSSRPQLARGAPGLPRRPTRSRPQLSSFIFVVLLVFGFLRSIGAFSGSEPPTATPAPPRPTSQAAHVTATPTSQAGRVTATPTSLRITPAAVLFGTGRPIDCQPTELGTLFPLHTPVYWGAIFTTNLSHDTKVEWRLYHDDQLLSFSLGPTRIPGGFWDRICADDPLAPEDGGTYRLEVWIWNLKPIELLASGEFVLSAPVTSSPSASPTP
jgi:hypothetical protein